MGFIVTRGFRNVFATGTGTAEINAGWGQPDDLIWAYSRQLKQIGERSRTQAAKLYVTENDMRHYSTPWRQFGNGEEFYDVGTPSLVEQAKKDRRWKTAARLPLAIPTVGIPGRKLAPCMAGRTLKDLTNICCI
jgi:hypothetical protein